MRQLAQVIARGASANFRKKAQKRITKMIIKITKAFSEAMVAFIGLWLLSGGLWMNGKSLLHYYSFFTLKYTKIHTYQQKIQK